MSFSNLSRAGLALSLAAALVAGSCSDPHRSGAPVLSFTAIPDQDTGELARRFAPLAEYLSTATGLEVRYVPSTDYEASVSMFETGDVQLAWFGGLTGSQARVAVPGSRAIAQGDVDPEFKSYFIANTALGLEPGNAFPFGLAGVTEFTYGSPKSTSGRLMPEAFLRAATGQTPAEFFGAEPVYAGTHDRTWKNVQDGVVQAGVLSYKVWDRDLAEGRIDPSKVEVLWTTPTYADYNWSVRGDVDERFGAGTIDVLQRALVDLADPVILEAVDRDDLIEATNADFADIDAIAAELGFL